MRGFWRQLLFPAMVIVVATQTRAVSKRERRRARDPGGVPFIDPQSRNLGELQRLRSEMVTRYGMAETLGPRTYARPPQPFLTGTTADRVVASEATEREIDIAVRDIVVKAFDRATEVLRKRRADLDEGARLLLVQDSDGRSVPCNTLGGSATKSAA